MTISKPLDHSWSESNTRLTAAIKSEYLTYQTALEKLHHRNLQRFKLHKRKYLGNELSE